jgi:AraC-like DNA-binding protein
MNHSGLQSINWDTPDVLTQIAEEVNRPLMEMMRLLHNFQNEQLGDEAETERLSAIMLESSEQIEQLIHDIKQLELDQQIEVLIHEQFKYPQLYQIKDQKISKADFDWFIELESLVLDHIKSSQLNISWLARQMMVSERSAFRKIEKYTGLTPNNYIRIIRLLLAKEIMENQLTRNLAETALAVGLKDQYYFIELFVKEFAIHPKSFF